MLQNCGLTAKQEKEVKQKSPSTIIFNAIFSTSINQICNVIFIASRCWSGVGRGHYQGSVKEGDNGTMSSTKWSTLQNSCSNISFIIEREKISENINTYKVDKTCRLLFCIGLQEKVELWRLKTWAMVT